MIRSLYFALPFLFGTAAHAVEAPPAMVDYVQQSVMSWATDPRIVAAIHAQNAAHAALDQAAVDSMDAQWRAEVGAGTKPMIDQVMGTPVSAFLMESVATSGGRITEAFVMDFLGLNVATSAITSDYWQGDEAKFQKSYGMGAGAIFVDEIELDESTQTYQGQVSIAISDPATGKVIGAITVGLDATAFF